MNPSSNRLFHIFFTALLIIMPSAHVHADDSWSRMDAFVERGMEMWHVPGMAVSVVSGSEIMYQKGFGTTEADGGKAVNMHTQFANASTTKAMVVAGLLMLADEGRLALDDTIIKHIPEVHFSDPMLTEQLTIRDMLSHRTGLPSTDAWTFFQGMPLDQQIQRLHAVRAQNPIRTRHIYQNTMYEMAGQIIERISGQRWDLFLKDRLWRPIGMLETYGSQGQIKNGQDRVLPYFFSDGELVQANWDFPDDYTNAAGSAWTSIHDMALWAQFLLRDGVTADGDRLISEELFEEMFKPQGLIARNDFYPTAALTKPDWTSYGLGWFQQNFQGRKIDFHTGSLSGLIAIIGVDRAEDRAVVVLGNRDHAEMRHAILLEVMDNEQGAEPRDWNQEIFDLYAGLAGHDDDRWIEAEKQRLKNTRLSLAGENYLGTWDSEVLGTMVVAKEGDQWILKAGSVDMPMSHWHLDTFVVEYPPWDLREFAIFRVGPDATVENFELFGEEFRPTD